MFNRMKNYIYLLGISTILFAACVEDEGNNDLHPINEITISGISDQYYVVSNAETLSITPVVTGTQSGSENSNFEYEWFLCNQGVTDANHEHETISREAVLEFPVNVDPSNYRLYLAVTDKSTGIRWEKSCLLYVLSPFVKGFYLFGNKQDGTVGLDFVGMIEGRDTTIVNDVMRNTLNLKGAQDIFFTGYYNDENSALWAITESGSYKVEYSSTQSSFGIDEDLQPDDFIFPTLDVKRPLKCINIWPHAYGSTNLSLARTARVFCTEHEIFNGSFYGQPEAYGNPINRYSASSSELFEPFPFAFYRYSSYVSYLAFYDVDHHRFVRLNSSLSFATNSAEISETDGTPFYFDQTKYQPLRHLVYGENGVGNNGRSYALMKGEDNQYYVYSFNVQTTVPTKVFSRNIDLSVATDFDKASHYTFYSMQTILLYSVGSKLYGYDYTRNEVKLLEDFGSEITYLAMDGISDDDPNEFFVATYSPSEKGVVRKLALDDNQNEIIMTVLPQEVWKTELRVVKVEYRNSTR